MSVRGDIANADDLSGSYCEVLSPIYFEEFHLTDKLPEFPASRTCHMAGSIQNL